LDRELAFVTWFYKYKNFVGQLKRKDFREFSTREEALKEFYKERGEDGCPNCGGEYQQIGKRFTAEGFKILIDGCKNCGYTRER